MNSDGERSAQVRLRHLLLEAASEEHRLRRRANREQEMQRRWQQRAVVAQSRKLDDLVAAAQARANRHARLAAALEEQVKSQRGCVEQLRNVMRYPGLGARPASGLVSQSVAQRADLTRAGGMEREEQLEQDLIELKYRRSKGRSQSGMDVERM